MFAHQDKNPNYFKVFAAFITKWQQTRHVVGTEKAQGRFISFVQQ
jgi:hypothetical protein